MVRLGMTSQMGVVLFGLSVGLGTARKGMSGGMGMGGLVGVSRLVSDSQCEEGVTQFGTSVGNGMGGAVLWKRHEWGRIVSEG